MVDIKWLGHASFKLEGTKRVYIDPWKIRRAEPADIILVSHDHYDHFSKEDIDKLRGPETVIVTVPGVASQLSGQVKTLSAGQSLEIDGVSIHGVPAYNLEKRFHPREKGWLGFVIAMGGETIYYAGDTDHIPEMADIRADTALLPVSGTYVMDPEEAARAANELQAGLFIPYHYGEIVGSAADAQRFKELATAHKVAILEREG